LLRTPGGQQIGATAEKGKERRDPTDAEHSIWLAKGWGARFVSHKFSRVYSEDAANHNFMRRL